MTDLLDYSVPHETLYAEYCRLHKENEGLQTTVHTLMESPSEHHVRPWNMGIVLVGFLCIGFALWMHSRRMDDIEKEVNRSIHAKAYCTGV